jgi:hypothetical protein
MDANLQANRILRELQYNFHDFRIDGFISFVGETKKRQIITIPWNMPLTLFGAWMSDEDEPKEYIFYRDDVPLIHQIHIQLHEISHFLLGHPTLRINRAKFAEVFEKKASFPFSDLLRLRSSDKTAFEVQAETLAALIQKEVIHHASLAQLLNDLSSETKLANLMNTMGFS